MASSRVMPEEESCFQCCWATIYHTGTKKTFNGITERPRVECIIKHENRSCDECLKRHHSCEKVAEFLEGDYFDMFALLRWSDQVALQPTRVIVKNSYVWLPLWTDEEKRNIIQVELDLMKKFREVENSHRVEHGMDVGKMRRVETGAANRYETAIQERRAALRRLRPAPVSAASQDVQAWHNRLLLRLEYGDKNFLTWANAKIAFVDGVLSMVDGKDARLVASYKQSLPSTTIVYS
ncbi:hypothetical protein BR93DRAFT_970610 [Coniochaeta sp. PMI_546]|nr:hypothetical protein BR93DRAFT_970610 [Coniochaeta sp. PMI_546]